jgi:response regulator of citrate/malate metabolism
MQYENIDYKIPMSLDNEQEQTPKPNTQINRGDLDKFKVIVREWLTVDDNIRKLKNALKEYNKKKKELEPHIMSFMSQNEIEDLNTKDGGRIKYHTTNAKKPLNKENMMKQLTQYFQNSTQATEVAEYLHTNRDTYERYSLKRTDMSTDR